MLPLWVRPISIYHEPILANPAILLDLSYSSSRFHRFRAATHRSRVSSVDIGYYFLKRVSTDIANLGSSIMRNTFVL